MTGSSRGVSDPVIRRGDKGEVGVTRVKRSDKSEGG
jgi:hypothetical protein